LPTQANETGLSCDSKRTEIGTETEMEQPEIIIAGPN